MGTDIHTVFQKKVNNTWIDISSEYEDNRHYFLFAWLANVRNGYGFAGVPITPISMPRGLPEDFLIDEKTQHPTTKENLNTWKKKYWSDEDKTIWLGDHSHSWLTFAEILEAPLPSGLLKEGIVSMEGFKAWDGKSQPGAYCGGVWGHDIIVAKNLNQITPQTTHVRIHWENPTGEFDYFLDELKRLKELHKDSSEFRIVFGFDS